MPLQYLRPPMYLPCRIEQLDVLLKQRVSQFIGMEVAIARLKQRQADLKIEACRFAVVLRAKSAMRYSISHLAEVIELIFRKARNRLRLSAGLLYQGLEPIFLSRADIARLDCAFDCGGTR